MNQPPLPPDSRGLLYHHCMPAAAAVRDILRPDRRFSCEEFRPAYEWVEEIVGFYPLFLAVGDDNVLTMTGYQDNWRVWKGSDFVNGKRREKYRRKGEFPNLAVLSFEDLDGVFMDYGYWHIALNEVPNGSTVSGSAKRWIFKPSWTKARWLRAALKAPFPVQLVVPELDLRDAQRVYVRNAATKGMMEGRGFPRVEVRRIGVEKW